MSTLDHPLRLPLANEAHARPFLRVQSPLRLSHLAVYQEGLEQHVRLLHCLCTALGIAPPAATDKHFLYRSNGFQLRWELHAEFSTFTFVQESASAAPFTTFAIDVVPVEWMGQLTGQRLVALHAEVLQGAMATQARSQATQWLPGPVLVGSKVLTGGEVWCDWQIQADGFSRFLILDLDFREAQVGRLVQRLCEIETYRMMALLTLPIARETAQVQEGLAFELSAIMQRMDAQLQAADDSQLLMALTHLAVRIEAISLHSGRFSAAQAYDRLVWARIAELREERIEGVPTIGEFMERRLSPAMDTCRSVKLRHEQLGIRVARAIDLLRTRVNLEQERQTNALLHGMNTTASIQLRLQHAVEGLSVVAISYYLLALIGLFLRAMANADTLPFNPEIVEGILILPVMFIVHQVVRRFRRKLQSATD